MERGWFSAILLLLNSCKSQLGETKARGVNVSFCFMSVSKWIDWNTLSSIKECFQGNVGSLACRAEGISCIQSFGIGEFLEQLFIELFAFLSCVWKKKKPTFSIGLDKLLSLHIRIILASRNRWNISLLAISMSTYPIPYNHLLLLVYICTAYLCLHRCMFPHLYTFRTHISIHEVILFLYIHVM